MDPSDTISGLTPPPGPPITLEPTLDPAVPLSPTDPGPIQGTETEEMQDDLLVDLLSEIPPQHLWHLEALHEFPIDAYYDFRFRLRAYGVTEQEFQSVVAQINKLLMEAQSASDGLATRKFGVSLLKAVPILFLIGFIGVITIALGTKPYDVFMALTLIFLYAGFGLIPLGIFRIEAGNKRITSTLIQALPTIRAKTVDIINNDLSKQTHWTLEPKKHRLQASAYGVRRPVLTFFHLRIYIRQSDPNANV